MTLLQKLEYGVFDPGVKPPKFNIRTRSWSISKHAYYEAKYNSMIKLEKAVLRRYRRSIRSQQSELWSIVWEFWYQKWMSRMNRQWKEGL